MIYIIGDENRERNCRMLQKAQEMTEGATSGKITLILWGEAADDCGDYGADEIIILKNSRDLMYYDTEKFVQTIIGITGESIPDLILFPSNALCREVAAVLGARLDRTVMTDCTDIWMQEGRYMCVKPSADGTHFSVYRLEGEKPYLAVVKSVTAKPVSCGEKTADIRTVGMTGVDSEGVRLIGMIREEHAKTNIRDAEIIFAGGRGMQNSDSFLALRQLADLYHASVGGSRPVVDSGWAETDEQVGQTGSFVRPKVYLAFGISGAVQHIAGMKESRNIIAVNVRKDAPIFRYCDYGVYGDANSIVRNMLCLLCQDSSQIPEQDG